MTHASLKTRNEARCRRLIARSELLDTADNRWDDAASVELDDGALACLAYMRDVEGFTTRDLVGFAGHPTTLADPIVAEFLTAWRAEEAEHTRALDRFLTAYSAGRGVPLPRAQPAPSAAVGPFERIMVRLTGRVGHVVTAAHMAWGAVNELLTLTGYRLLARRCRHPVLDQLLGRIAAQEARHYSFYALQTEWRLAASPLARAVVPRLLERQWTPVGVGADYKQPAEFDQVLTYLTGADSAHPAVGSLDRRLGRLPGFRNLTLYTSAARQSVAAAVACDVQ